MVIAPLKRKPLGEILVAQGLIDKEQLKECLEDQKKSKQQLGEILLRKKYITEEDLLRARAFQHGLTYKPLATVEVEEDIRKIIPLDMIKRYKALPLQKKDNMLEVAMADPANVVAVEEIQSRTGLKIHVVLSSERAIDNAVDKLYGGLAGLRDLSEEAVQTVDEDEDEALPEGEYDAEDAPIVKYVNSLLVEAVEKNASDVHLEPFEDGVSLRFRMDGNLTDFPAPKKGTLPAIISRIKIMANLDIAERRLPQDGKCRIKINDNKIDIRVSTLPTIYGEKLVMRILDKSELSLDMDKLGFSGDNARMYTQALTNPYGMILVTGPTGSGKTTTLYAGLDHINKPDKNIVTIEDPVEYELKKINQVQVKPVIELNFASILRAVLRQDPDVIMVGEIRDRETAEIAIQAALTGHLVLSTLHTNDAVSTLSRLKYMGIDQYLVADAVKLVIAQRLIRKICPSCRREQKVPENMLNKLNLPDTSGIKFYYGKGCDECFGTGYKGRTAVYEMLPLSPAIKKLVVSDSDDITIKEQAVQEGMRTLREMAVEKLINGETTVEEVLTVTFG